MIENLVTAWPVFKILLLGVGSIVAVALFCMAAWWLMDKVMEGKHD